jgi:hypothetical protein
MRMAIHMKTTLVIDGGVMRRLREESARTGKTLSELVEAALRSMLNRPSPSPGELPPLPVFHGGAPRVDLADRDALYQAMEGR